MQKTRRETILEIISQYEIKTQQELLQKLNERGFSSTQATISRDIKKLNLIKQPPRAEATGIRAPSAGRRNISNTAPLSRNP